MKNPSLRHMVYELKCGYLLLPGFITVGLSIVAICLPELEIYDPAVSQWAEHASWITPSDPGMAQLLLAATAGSCITVVSVVYSILLIALTFASIQFSPRILMSFLKDRVSQTTLGMFIGTFAYCLLLLPRIHDGHAGRDTLVPALSLMGALLLATICLFYLIFFIHHIAISIQANYVVDRIARETEDVMRKLFGGPLKGFPRVEEPLMEPSDGAGVASIQTGYIQFIDETRLLTVATKAKIDIYYYRGIGQFIAAGVPLLIITPFIAADAELRKACLACFHIGPLRSMEDDVEFGILQMVDIALKAISPAVNDPSTAISCIDHLSVILLLAATLEPPSARVLDEHGVVRLARRQPSFPRLLQVAYNQIGPYGKNDMAVSLRLMRALHDISGLTNYPPYLEAIRTQAQRVVKACAACFPEEDCQELFDRMTIIEKRQRSAPQPAIGTASDSMRL
jgi:uncharacterized membrane protein